MAVALLAVAKFAIQMATSGQYGIFRDELYYVALARHLAWGYVDEPPLIALVTWLTIHILGTSLYALRFLPAVAGGALVWVTSDIARELGGGRSARVLAGFAVIPVPIYLMLNHWLTMNAFKPLLWTTLSWAALRLTTRAEPRYWIAIGALCGVGLENKYSMLFPMAGLALGLMVTPERRMLKTCWVVAGGAIALALFLPNLLWLIHHDFPFLAFERGQRMSMDRIARDPLAFVADQIMIMNPLLAPLWIGGLAWLLVRRPARAYRFLGCAFLGIFLPLLALRAKNYYVAPAYPVLFAAGAVALERATEFRARWGGARWVRGAYAGTVLAAGLFLAPFVLPVLPVKSFLAYQRAFGGFTPIRLEKTGPSLLPQQFADEFGWDAMARQTALVFNSLPETERNDTAIFANNFGEAAAIDFFGPAYGLPNAIGKDVNYWLWGPRDYTGRTVIVLGGDGTGDREHFRTVEAAASVGDAYARADEHFDIYLCRGLSTDLDLLWPRMKGW